MAGSTAIRVDQDELDKQIAVLRGLVADETLLNYGRDVIDPLLMGSKGIAVGDINELNHALSQTVKQLYDLINATIAALSNVAIVEADAGLANQIAQGTVPPEG